MAYPEDQGLIIPQFGGYKLLDWYKDEIICGDLITPIGRDPIAYGGAITQGFPIPNAESVWHSYRKTHCIYRRIASYDTEEWEELGETDRLIAGDVVTLKGYKLPSTVDPLVSAFDSARGYCVCFSPGYGSGWTLRLIKIKEQPNADKAWRRKGTRRRLPPNPAKLTEALPLP